jgi:hypothetical protein
VIGIVTGALALWCLLSLPIGIVLGRSMSIGTRVEAGRRVVSLHSLRSIYR